MVDAKASKAFVQAEHESSSLSPCNKANAQLQKKAYPCPAQQRQSKCQPTSKKTRQALA